jgi:predicted nucleic acid-binding protein
MTHQRAPQNPSDRNPLYRKAFNSNYTFGTGTEVVKLKNLGLLDEQTEQLVADWFENDYISIRNVDRFVAEKARPIVRKCGVKPADATHIATAILMEVEVMHTFDVKLVGLSGLAEVGDLKIEEPPEP